MKLGDVIKIGKLYRFFQKMTIVSAIKLVLLNMLLLIIIGFLIGGAFLMIDENKLSEKGTLGELYLTGYWDFLFTINYESIFIGSIASLLIIRKMVTVFIEKRFFKNKLIDMKKILETEVRIKKNRDLDILENEFSELIVRKINSEKILNSNKSGMSVIQINYMNKLNSLWLLENSTKILMSDLICYGDSLEEDFILFKQNIKLLKYGNDDETNLIDSETKVLDEQKVDFQNINEKIFSDNMDIFENKASIDSIIKKIKVYNIFSYGISIAFLTSVIVYFLALYTNNDDLYINSIFLFIFSALYYLGYQYALHVTLLKPNDDWFEIKNATGYFQGLLKKYNPKLNNENIRFLSLYYSLYFLNIIDVRWEITDEEKIEVAYNIYANYNLELLHSSDLLLPEYFMLHTFGYSKLIKLMPIIY